MEIAFQSRCPSGMQRNGLTDSSQAVAVKERTGRGADRQWPRVSNGKGGVGSEFPIWRRDVDVIPQCCGQPRLARQSQQR